MIKVSQVSDKLGIYVHVPFCAQGKCPYCDFYSVTADNDIEEKYIEAVKHDLHSRAYQARCKVVDTVYFGGGTPSLLGVGLARLLCCIGENYSIADGAEITFEANPADIDFETLALLKKAGFNRLSLGMQSAVQSELDALCRRHTNKDVERAVKDARRAGFDNISLDLMLCIPGQTYESMQRSVDFAASLSPRHISAYLLKIEKGTHYYDIRETLNLPDDDAQADMYLAACEALEQKGYFQYEISNFAIPGYESRHNIKYWDCGEYLGFGPAAHSFFDGRRFFNRRSLDGYITGSQPVQDGTGGSLEEYVMLRLRLTAGINENELRRRYGVGFLLFDNAVLTALEGANLIKISPGCLTLTRKGFLVSNAVISELIFHQKS